jgi:CubicO group peptidase (beta-lactamase class C family)
MKMLKWLGLALLVLLVGGGWYAYPQLRIATGYGAKMACSCYYFQGRSLADIQASDLNFSVLPLLKLSLNEQQQAVTATILGFVDQTAYWRGDGCTLQADAGKPLPPERVLPSPASPPLPLYDTFPPGLDTTLLAKAADLAFQPVPGGGTRGFAILHQGRLVYERYAPGFGPETPLLGWSMTKSITNALVGLAVKHAYLKTEEQELFAAWHTDARAAISLEDLLQMNSGLAWNEAYGSVSDATTMLYLEPSMGQYALSQAADLAPAQYWAYSSGTTNILSYLLRERLGTEQGYSAILYDSLFAKVGMSSARVERDQSNHFVCSSYGWATVRDWARFGQLYLQDGQWNGEQLLPPGWVDYSRQPAEGSEGAYGAQIWLQTEDVAAAPADIFMFRGFQDQRILIIPSHQAVIVRLGMNADQTFPLNEVVAQALLGLPKVN